MAIPLPTINKFIIHHVRASWGENNHYVWRFNDRILRDLFGLFDDDPIAEFHSSLENAEQEGIISTFGILNDYSTDVAPGTKVLSFSLRPETNDKLRPS